MEFINLFNQIIKLIKVRFLNLKFYYTKKLDCYMTLQSNKALISDSKNKIICSRYTIIYLIIQKLQKNDSKILN